MYRRGEIKERWYDLDKLNIDNNSNGIEYILNSGSERLCCSKVLYYDEILVDNSLLVEAAFGSVLVARDKRLDGARTTITTNEECERKLTLKLNLTYDDA